ncbi:MAG TPA: GntR family transcriptional regulator [Granulicella sp.]
MPEAPPSTLRTHVAQRLRKDILAGKYKPGDRLNESSIAREFKISRIPVREALFELRESGLVMNRERRGMFVTSLSEDEIQKINSVRVILEVEALSLARQRMTPKVAAQLKALVDKMESSNASVLDAAAIDLEFHRTIWAATGNEYLQRVLDPLATLLFAHNLLERVSLTHRNWRLNHHRALLDVILAPQNKDIRSALLTHLQAAYPTESESAPAAPATASRRAPSAPRTTKKKAAKKSA